MLYGEYSFHAVLEDEAVLPAFKGSTFRGVFGWALKDVVCALKRQECPTCLLRHQCVYIKVFDTLPDPVEKVFLGMRLGKQADGEGMAS